MDLQILPIDPSFSARVLEDLAVITEDSRSFEELIYQWVDEDRSMAFARNDATDEHCVGISFSDVSGGTFVGKLPTAEVLTLYRGQHLFPANIALVTDEWMDQRNEALHIHLDEQHDSFLAPPESLGELIIAYALAPLGYAEITTREFQNEPYLFLDLVYFEKKNMPAWGEEFFISRSRLEEYVKRMPG